MSTPEERARMLTALRELLQEEDANRRLDSLEVVVVLTYLRGHSIEPPQRPEDYPSTIEEWVAWVEKPSPVS